MNSAGIVFAEASPSQISATMVLIVLVVVTAFIVLRRKPDEDPEDPPLIVTFECESCGEDLDTDESPCPMCGGPVLRKESPH